MKRADHNRIPTLAELCEFFGVDDMESKLGHFTRDVYNIEANIYKLRARMTDPDPRSGRLAVVPPPGLTADDLFHGTLLGFAEYMLTCHPMLMPAIGFIAGYVADDHRPASAAGAKTSRLSGANAARVSRLFDKIDDKLAEYKTLDHILGWAFETHFCAARMVSFESQFSAYTHGLCDQIMSNIMKMDMDNYCTVVATAAENAHEYPCANSLLLHHFNSSMQTLAREVPDGDAAGDTHALRRMTELSGKLAATLPDDAGIAGVVTESFSKNWDALHARDAWGAFQALNQLRRRSVFRGFSGGKFVDTVKKKFIAYNKAAGEELTSFEAPLALPAPKPREMWARWLEKTKPMPEELARPH